MYNLIDETAIIGQNTTVEYGAVVSDHVVVGDNCFIGYHSIIRPLVIIGDYSEIRAHCFVAEGVKIGKGVKVIQFSNVCKNCVLEDNVFFGANVITMDTKKVAHGRDYTPYGEPPYIEYGARIGSGVVIIPGVRIGRNSMIQAGSLVTKDTEPYGIYRGHPAIKIGEIPKDERI